MSRIKALHSAVIILLLHVICVDAMDMTTLSTLCSSVHNFFKSPVVVQEDHIDRLSVELHGKIIKNVFTLIVHENYRSKERVDQKKLEKYVLTIPILLGATYAHEFNYLQQMCEWSIGGKYFLAQELFVLPRKEREVFIRTGNRSTISRTINGDVSADDYKIIAEMTNDNIKKGLILRVNTEDKKINYMYGVHIVSEIGLGVCGASCFILVPLLIAILPEKNVYLSLMPAWGIVVCFALAYGSGVLGGFRRYNGVLGGFRRYNDDWPLKKVKF